MSELLATRLSSNCVVTLFENEIRAKCSTLSQLCLPTSATSIQQFSSCSLNHPFLPKLKYSKLVMSLSRRVLSICEPCSASFLVVRLKRLRWRSGGPSWIICVVMLQSFCYSISKMRRPGRPIMQVTSSLRRLEQAPTSLSVQSSSRTVPFLKFLNVSSSRPYWDAAKSTRSLATSDVAKRSSISIFFTVSSPISANAMLLTVLLFQSSAIPSR